MMMNFLKKKITSFNGLYRETFANVKSIKNEISYRNLYPSKKKKTDDRENKELSLEN